MSEKEIVDFSDYTNDNIVLADWYDIIFEFGFQLGAMLALSILVLYTLLKTPTKFYIKFFTIPLIFFLFYSTIVKLNNFLGYAHPSYPSGKVILINGQRSGPSIEIWVQHIGDPKTKLYRIPYTKEIQEEVKRGERMKKTGNPLVIEFEPGKLSRSMGGETEGGQYKTYRLRDVVPEVKKSYLKDE